MCRILVFRAIILVSLLFPSYPLLTSPKWSFSFISSSTSFCLPFPQPPKLPFMYSVNTSFVFSKPPLNPIKYKTKEKLAQDHPLSSAVVYSPPRVASGRRRKKQRTKKEKGKREHEKGRQDRKGRKNESLDKAITRTCTITTLKLFIPSTRSWYTEHHKTRKGRQGMEENWDMTQN